MTNTEWNESNKPGWYAIGFENIDGVVEYGQIYQYHGDGFWTNDDGEEVERLWDPVLQNWIAVDGADAYAVQS